MTQPAERGYFNKSLERPTSVIYYGDLWFFL